jgi:2-polyprenyl-6-methoxyphenol hydroxylase-like FAD-dependent oxidoreductase
MSKVSQIIQTDIAIVGGGIAGSTAAVLLQNAGVEAVLIDPHAVFPKDFRCEKFNRDQMEMLERVGISGNIYAACTPIEDIWIARQGRLVNKMHYPHYGFSYETAINSIRAYLEETEKLVQGKVKAIQSCKAGNRLILADGSQVEAKLVIMANGLNPGLRKQLDISQTMLSKQHEMAIGFDIEPIEGNKFEFDSFTFWPEKSSEKLAYFTAFKSGKSFRVNTFGYWDKDDVFMQAMKQNPEEALNTLMPSLEKLIGKFKVDGRVHVRPVDLYQNHPEKCDGIVFVGDAYSTSCPGAGTGTSKAVTDVEILCSKYIPQWLDQNRFDADTLSEFYQDETKRESDASSLHEAYFLKSLSLEKSLIWGARRWMRYFYHVGKGAVSGMPIIAKKKKLSKAA